MWVGAEALRARVPFGGFPWGRVAFGQPDGPLLPVAAVGGAPLLSFVTVLAGLALGEAAAAPGPAGGAAPPSCPRWSRSSRWRPARWPRLLPPAGSPPVRTVTVAAVQGNVPRLGLDFNAQRRAVLDNHVRVTEQLAADVAAGTPPTARRGAVAGELLGHRPAAQPRRRRGDRPGRPGRRRADRARHGAGRPGRTQRRTRCWSGQPGVGVVDRTDKRRVQPFGEYLPWRPFFRLLSEYVDRAGNFVPGTGAGRRRRGGRPAGVAICWEVAFDDLVADSVDAGAQVLAVPSNNATFGRSEMTYQQLAMSRVRAVEHDRAVLVVTTSGVSATIAPDGTVTATTSTFTPDVLVDATPLRATTTLAGRLRAVPEWALLAAGLAGVGLARGRRAGRPTRRLARSRRAGRAGAGEDEDG